MYGHLFTYGSLMFPELLTAITGDHYQHIDAVLLEYSRFQLKNAKYPGIIASDASSQTCGRLYWRLKPRALELLDAFEGNLYERKRLQVQCANGLTAEAFVYVVSPHKSALLSRQTWEPERFRQRHLKNDIAVCRQQRQNPR